MTNKGQKDAQDRKNKHELIQLDPFTTLHLLDENPQPLIAGSLIKKHLQNLHELHHVDKHPFAKMISRFYGFNGETRTKRDFCEYMLQIRLDLINMQSQGSRDSQFPSKTIYEYVQYAEKHLSSKNELFTMMLFKNLWRYVGQHNSEKLDLEKYDQVIPNHILKQLP